MDEVATTSSGRGKGSCPNCNESYVNRYKPKNCPRCGFEIGGSYCPKKKKVAKPVVPASTLIYTDENTKICSVMTTNRNNRCFVTIENDIAMCHNVECKEARAVFVHSGESETFSCEHSKKVGNSSQPIWMVCCSSVMIESYLADEQVKSALLHVINDKPDFYHVVQISEKVFATYCNPTASNPLGYSHVNKEGQFYSCQSKECRKGKVKTKQRSFKNICIHIHMLLCCLPHARDVAALGSALEGDVPGEVVVPSGEVEEIAVEEGSVSRQSTKRLYEKFLLPYEIDKVALARSKEMDSNTALGLIGWPEVFEPLETQCGLCKSSLRGSRYHPGASGNGVLFTNLNPFHKIQIKVKMCSERSCQAMHRVMPIECALFNVSDKVLLSFDILLEWRELFRRGVPVSVMIEAKLASFINTHDQAYKECGIQRDYLVDLLYNAFYCFESVTERDLDQGICGICGIIGELYLGDGNEKNCCSIKNIEYPKNQEQSTPMELETFMSKIKEFWMEKTLYTRASESFLVNMVDVPPIIPPSVRSANIQITEANKKSSFLNHVASRSVEGDSAMLHHMITTEKLDMSNIEGMDRDTLERVCNDCGITTSGKSKSAMQLDLQTLYATLLVGYSPCHNFTQVPGHTGGFYHVVCRHGCTVASKFLLLQESTRDPTDLYLSLRYPPPVFVCDTPCGVVRHMDARCPDVTSAFWGEEAGCFEKPSLNKSPEEDIDVPEIVPLEYRLSSVQLSEPDDLDQFVHPVTGKSRRYVLGDRFHATTNPHKSLLCAFHDINLCRQANVFGTSIQEMKNNQKNKKRLRSSCVQSFGVHFLYNFLMDFYENEDIVKRQKEVLLKRGKEVKRDVYKRFYFS